MKKLILFLLFFSCPVWGAPPILFNDMTPAIGFNNTNDTVGIGTTGPSANAVLDLSSSTKALLLPTGTTGQRPTATNGMMRYNSTIPSVEHYINGAWNPVTILQGTFANKPAGAVSGTHYFATDLGAGGIDLVYTGSIWKPSTGVGVIINDYSTHSISCTGSEATVYTVNMPAGIPSATGSIRIWANSVYTGVTAGKTVIIKISATSGSQGGTTILSQAFGGSTTALGTTWEKVLHANNSTSSQVMSNTNTGGVGISTTQALLTTSIATGSAWYFNLDVNGNASDTCGFQGIIVEWLE